MSRNAMDTFGSDNSQMHSPEKRTDEQSMEAENSTFFISEPRTPPILPVIQTKEDQQYLCGYKLGIVISGLWLGTMLVAIDNTIIGIVVPKISTQFNALEDVGWYGSAYLLTVTACQPSFGKLYKYFDSKVVYLVSITVFEAGSAICAAAPTSPAFITGRAIAGVGAAGIFQGGLTIVSSTVALEKRPLYLGIIVSAFGIAVAFGPPLGGVLTDHLSWRWCFWINLPIGAAVLGVILTFLRLRNSHNEDRNLPLTSELRNLDYDGAIILFGACCCLLLALQWGGTQYSWNSSRIIGLLVGLGLLTLIFLIHQRIKGKNATIPFHIVGQRSVLMGSLFICCSQATSMVLAYYLPFFFQAVQNLSATASGVRYLALVLPQIFAVILAGVAVTKTGHYVPYMIVGQSVAVIGLGLLTQLRLGMRTAEWLSFMAIAGIGIGTAVQLPFSALQIVLRDEDLPTGNAIMTFFSQLGGTISVSIAQNIFMNALSRRISKIGGQVSFAAVMQAGATRLMSLGLPKDVFEEVQEAFSYAVARTVILSVALSAIAIIFAVSMEWKNLKTEATARKAEGIVVSDEDLVTRQNA